MSPLFQDIRYAARTLRKSPVFAAVAVLTLALGIGANSAIFTLINTVLLRPLPFPEPERLVFLWEKTSMFGITDSPVALGNYTGWRAESRSFEEMGALEGASFRLTGGNGAQQVSGGLATASLFRTLGVKPALGRLFREDEDQAGAAKVVLLSDTLWRNRYGANPGVVGTEVSINDEKHTIVGVMPPGFRFANAEVELWSPLGAAYPASEFSARGRHNFMVAARLKPGVTLQQADQDVRAIAARAERAYPQTNAGIGAFAAPLREHFVGDQRVELMALCGAVGFVLLIACANISNLLLSRACNRKHEMAIRTAIGANNWHILRQLFAENLLLAGAGAVCGLLLTKASIRLLQSLVPDGITSMQPISMDLRVLAFTLVVALFTTVLFGLFPFLQVFKLDIQQVLKQGGARDGGGRNARRVEGTLVVSQVALAFVLMLGALLMIQAYGRLRDVDPGFRTDNLLTMGTPLARARYDTLAKRKAYYDEVLRRVTALPGVVSAGFANHLPIAFKGDLSGVNIEGRPVSTGSVMAEVGHRVITSDYLQTLGVPLHAGRYLTNADNEETIPVALINQTMQRRFWPNENPVGKRFAVGQNPWVTVVGVVGDMKEGLNLPARPEMYFPATQRGAATSLAIRTRGNPALLSGAVRQVISSIDGDQPITHESTMEEILDKSVSPRHVQMLLLSTFAGLAVLLAGIGIYGVLAYVVAQRQREIGIRMALGARPASILQSIVGHGVTLSAIGIAIGVCTALSLARPVSQLLFGISFTDPLTFTSTAALLLGIACLASYIPARRAMRVDPLVALRNE